MVKIMMNGNNKIALDGRKLKDFGIGTYISNLFKYSSQHYKSSFCLITYPNNLIELSSLNEGNSYFISTNAKLYSLEEHIVLSRIVNKMNFKLYHSPHYVVPLLIKCKIVVTIHDIIHLLYPSKGTVQKLIAKALLYSAINKSNQIITVSESSKKDILTFFPSASKKIIVIHNGVDEFYLDIPHNKELKEVVEKYSLPKKYILYVGNNLKHKNINRLIKAFTIFSKSNNEYFLVFVGGIKKKNIIKLITNESILDRIITLPFLDRRELRAVYYLSEFLVMPSLYEGFGLPVLEAMACRSAVLCSRLRVFEELYGDIPQYVNPLNIEDIANGMLKMSEDKS
jgi:glycosyltransferase involved in cell wall biosynthesis